MWNDNFRKSRVLLEKFSALGAPGDLRGTKNNCFDAP